MRRALAFAALWACHGAAPPVAAVPLPGQATTQTYAIRLDRPAHVGDRARVLATGDEEIIETIRRGAEVLDSSRKRKTARLRATSVVLEVSARGEAIHVGYEDAVLEYEHDDKRAALVQHGRIELVRAPKSDDARILVDGAPGSSDVRDALDLLVSFRSGGPRDDEIFGTKVPQSIGGRWPIDAARARADLESDKDMRAASLSGDAWLERVENIAGLDCLDVAAHVVVDGIDFGSPGPPAGSKVEVARASASFSGSFPVDGTTSRLIDRTVFEMTVKMRTPTPNGDAEIEMDSASHREGHYTPLALTPRAAASR
jgi:hypothetical protein